MTKSKTRRLSRAANLIAGLGLFGALVPGGTAYAASTWSVDTITDENDHECAVDCSLRDAIELAVSGDAIEFDPSLVGGTITLALGQLAVAKDLVIAGPGAAALTISGNDTTRVLLISQGTVTISGLTIADGFAMGSTVGGGVLNKGVLTLNDSRVHSNRAFHGGGIYNNGELNANHTQFTSNETTSQSGGAILNDIGIFEANGPAPNHGKLRVTDSTFAANTTLGGGGGAIYNLIAGDVRITGSTFEGNIAGTLCCGQGGAIHNSSGGMHVSNSTFVDNHANGFGGAFRQFNGSATIVNSTFVNNSVTGIGNPAGGLYTSGATVVLRNSIAAGNHKIGGPSDLELGSGGFSVAYSLIGDAGNSGVTNGVNGNKVGYAAPLVVESVLANNGGLTETLALVADSPAKDAGSNALALDGGGNPLLTDQRGPGFGRIIDDTVDMGAFEAGLPPLDHFQCYEANHVNTGRQRVLLQDQFGQRFADLESPARFCNPTEKARGEEVTEISDPNAHLTWYRIRKAPPKFLRQQVVVNNQFGEQTLTVERPMFLAVPSQKLSVDGISEPESQFPEGLDHFTCYYAKGSRLNEEVGLRDQFDGEGFKDARVMSPAFLCVPADKLLPPDFEEGYEAQRPEDLLTCYTMEAGKSRRTVTVSNQLAESLDLNLSSARLLCVPSTSGLELN